MLRHEGNQQTAALQWHRQPTAFTGLFGQKRQPLLDPLGIRFQASVFMRHMRHPCVGGC